jgi:septal ring factor EnvC (AmiA/AmiB activator)
MNYTSLLIFFFIQSFIFSLVIAVEEDTDLNSLKYEQIQNYFDNDDFSVIGNNRKRKLRNTKEIEEIKEQIAGFEKEIEVKDKEITELKKQLKDKKREKETLQDKKQKKRKKLKHSLKVIKKN